MRPFTPPFRDVRRGALLLCALLLLALVLACQNSAKTPTADGDEDSEQSDVSDESETDAIEAPDADAETEAELSWPASSVVPSFALVLERHDSFAADLKSAKAAQAKALVFSGDYLLSVEDLDGESADAVSRRALLSDVMGQTRAAGLEAWIVSRSFGRSAASLCLAKASPFWAEREALYDRVATALPSLSGLVVSFGDAPLDPWDPLCTCDACRNAAGHLEPYSPSGPERIAYEIEAAAKSVILGHKLGFVVRVKSGDPLAIGLVGQAGALVPQIPFMRLHALPLEDGMAFGAPDFSAWQWDDRPRLFEIQSQGLVYGPAIMGGLNPDSLPWWLSRLPAPKALWLDLNAEELGADPWPLPPLVVGRLSQNPQQGGAQLYDPLFAQSESVLGPEARSAWLGILQDSWRAMIYAHDVDGVPAFSLTGGFPKDATLSGLDTYRGDLSQLDPRYQGRVRELRAPTLASLINNWNEDAAAAKLAADILVRYDAKANLWPVSWAQTVRPRLAAQELLVRIWQHIALYSLGQGLKRQIGADPSLDSYLQGAFEKLVALRDELGGSILANSASVGLAQLDRYLYNVKSLKPVGVLAALPAATADYPLTFTIVDEQRLKLSFVPPRTAQYTLSYGPHPQTLNTSISFSLLPAQTEQRQLLEPTPGSTTFFRLSAEGGGQNDQGPVQWFFFPAGAKAR